MKRKLFHLFSAAALTLLTFLGAGASEVNPDIRKVHIIFKTHLDIGFTDLSSVVERKYIENFIPKAIDVAQQLREAGGEERYVWTTGSWVIASYLEQASKKEVRRLEDAIKRGDIVWNAMPYTTMTEVMTREHLRTILRLSEQLDKKYGKKTIAAKMTDVPGHTRGIIPVFNDAGIKMLHIGVNKQSYAPEVPEISRWRDPHGNEIILMLVGHYGTQIVLPDHKTVLAVFFTGDNRGPHTIEQVKEIYAGLRERYPNAELKASTLCAVAEELENMKGQLPVLTQELGDTWIHGMGSAPVRMAKFRALSRLYSQWIEQKKIDPASNEAIHFAVRLGMIAEHTWGIDVKTHLRTYDVYDFDKFNASRQLPAFLKAEQSWQEIDNYIEEAIAFLPASLRSEAEAAIAGIGNPEPMSVTGHEQPAEINERGALLFEKNGISMLGGELAYQTFSAGHYDKYYTSYLDKDDWTNLAAVDDFIKPGLRDSEAEDATTMASVEACQTRSTSDGKEILCKLTFDENPLINADVLPAEVYTRYTLARDGKSADMELTLINKPANRLPEAYWYSFRPENVVKIFVEKLGERIDVMDVVKGGNRQMHGLDRYVDLVTTRGTIRITSLDANIVEIGERTALDFNTDQPDIRKGVHFCLFNNLWGTNFTMWWGGSMTYRFRIELLAPDADPEKDNVALMVRKATYEKLQAEIDRYKEDVEKRFPVNLQVVVGEWETPREVREQIKLLCDPAGLEGVILVGDMPLHRFYMHYFANPNALYYEDPMMEFNDETVATSYSSKPNPQIWVANMRAVSAPDSQGIEELRRFLDKTHAYYTGRQQINNDMLIVAGHEWPEGGRLAEREMRGCFDRIDTLIGNGNDKRTFVTRDKILDTFSKNYRMFYIQVHSNETRQDLEGGGSIFADPDIYEMKTGALCILNMGCSNGNFFKAVGRKNTAQSWVFGKGVGQGVITQVRVGLVYGYENLFARLKAGDYFGKAYLTVKRAGEKEMFEAYNGTTVSGVTYLGNPFLYAVE